MTFEFLRAKFLKKSKAVWLSPNKEGNEEISTIALPHWSLKPESQESSLSKEWEESASMISHMCGFKNPPPWCVFISMSCSISKTLPSWQLLDWRVPGPTRHGGWATGILAGCSPFPWVTGRAAEQCESWLDDVAKRCKQELVVIKIGQLYWDQYCCWLHCCKLWWLILSGVSLPLVLSCALSFLSSAFLKIPVRIFCVWLCC